MQKTILVIGATGTLGEPVARCLKEDGFHVRVLTRDKNKAKKLFDESFEITEGNVTDVQSLEQPLKGCWGVHINLTPRDIEELGG